MNVYTYDQIVVGQEERFTFEITEQHMILFREITGDANPIHTDIEYAKSKGFPNKVVYGMLTASFLSTLAGMYLPGKHSLIYEVIIKFAKPLYPDGGALTISGVCTDKQDRFKRIEIKVRIADSNGKIVLRGTMKVGVVDDEQ